MDRYIMYNLQRMFGGKVMNERAKFIEVTPEQRNRIDGLRNYFSEIYTFVDLTLKPGRETSLVYDKLEEAQFWAIKGITREEQSNAKMD